MQNNLFFELLPLVAFFAIYYVTKNIFLATGICIIASWLQLILYKVKYNNISKNTWISTILITIFGGLTILFHNKTFVMLKPTVLYWIIAVSLFVSAKINKNGIKLMLAKEINLPDRVWQKLNFAWVCFFFIMGVANLVVATLVAKNYLNEFFWVKFKVFGGTFLTITFTILCGIIIYAYQKKFEKNNKNLKQV